MRGTALPLTWLRRLLLAGAIAAAVGWLPYQVYGHSSLGQLVKMRGELGSLRAGNQTMRTDNARLRAELGLYAEDNASAVEGVARDELGLVKPGELVFKVIAPEGQP